MNIFKKHAKRGQMQLLGFIISIGVTIFVIGGLVLGLAAFNSSTTDANATSFLNSGLDMFQNFGSQLGTVGTLVGVGLLIAVIVGAFAVGRLRGGGGGF